MNKIIGILFAISCTFNGQAQERWSKEKANEWYAAQPWLVGCNFIPSTAINQLEMWQPETFDTATIDRELGWAAAIGMNTARVFLHDLVYQTDPQGFKQRIDVFLKIADKHGIRPCFVFFDDCWNTEPKAGVQPQPVPGVHNSGWMESPGKRIVNKPAEWGRLEVYVKDILTTFGQDKRILFWDLYNEPGGKDQCGKSLPLLKATFSWARQANPTQPLTSGTWLFLLGSLNRFQYKNSDIISFHQYASANALKHKIKKLKKIGRPLICTEWMARKLKSIPSTHLPIFKEHKVACYNWGLVSGKTQTIYPWQWLPSKSNNPQALWFHDLFYPDGKPYNPEEINIFRQSLLK